MEVPHAEGLATHGDPESCGRGGNAEVEALTGGVRAGRLSRESFVVLGAQAVPGAEGNTGRADMARHERTWRGQRTLARTQGSCTGTGRSLDPSVGDAVTDRPRNPEGERSG
jgi:hypothetical protein